MVTFAQVNGEIVIDKIPLAEIESVRDMHSIENEDLEKSKHLNQFMIETHTEGYNSGRTYYLKADSKDMCRNLIVKLDKCAVKARERANAKTAFALAQQRVGKVYNSTAFQNFFALLILAVTSQIHWHHAVARTPSQSSTSSRPQNFIVCILDAQYRSDAATSACSGHPPVARNWVKGHGTESQLEARF